MITIATWNVNSIKARLQHLLDWLAGAAPDVVLLQETKCIDEAFPAFEIEAAGYQSAAHGQPTYNGVAILSKTPIEVTQTGLAGDHADGQARYIEGRTAGVRVASIYLPNGNPLPGPKFDYKLAWMQRLYDHVRGLALADEALVLGGDWNVAPEDGDVYDLAAFAGDALCMPESRAAWRKIVYLGLTDAYRARHPEAGRFTWWDYRAGGWQKDHGTRIDHFLLGPRAADRLDDCDIDRTPRGWEKASDHTPIWVRLLGA